MAITDNMVSYWKFDESSGNAADSIGSLTLTNTGVSYSAGKIRNGADAGTSVSVNKTLLGGTPVTNLGAGAAKSVFGWFKVNANPTAFARFIDWRRSAGSSGEFALNYFLDGGTYQFSFNLNGGSMSNYVVTLPLSTWIFLAITCDASNNAKFYIDDAVVRTGTWGAAGAAANHTQFNGANGGTTGNFSGPFSWDEWGSCNKELSATELAQIRANGGGRQYPFGQNGFFAAPK